jgi:hypothetical protein
MAPKVSLLVVLAPNVLVLLQEAHKIAHNVIKLRKSGVVLATLLLTTLCLSSTCATHQISSFCRVRKVRNTPELQFSSEYGRVVAAVGMKTQKAERTLVRRSERRTNDMGSSAHLNALLDYVL